MARRFPVTDRDWRGFIVVTVIAVAGILLGYLALAVAIDPYETGRSTLFSRNSVRPQGPRTAVVLRGRNPAYDAAVIGNSHIQLVEPATLSKATGLSFVQLSVPATGPAEQFAVLDWFLRHHPAPKAIVLSADEFWCTDDPAFTSEHPFPYWLIGDWPAYLRGLLRFAAAQETVVRIGWLLNPHRNTAVSDGWWNYETNYLMQGFGRDPKLIARLEIPGGPESEPHLAGPFPIAGRFRAALSAIPARTPVVLVFPPVYAVSEPPPGSPRAKAEASCREAIRADLAAHPLSTIVDWRDGRPQTHDPTLFFDKSHYRVPLGEMITSEIATAILRLRAETPR